MSDQLKKVLKRVVQRTSSNTGKLRTEDERAAFSNNVRADIASILEQVNSVYYPLISTLMSEQTLNAIDYGLSGNVMKTNIAADAASAAAYWDTTVQRARTIKETVDVLLSEIARVESLISSLTDSSEYDDSELLADLAALTLDLQQLKKDTMGPNYQFDGDGVANLTFSVSQALDALGALFGGWPGTGNTYSTTFPTLTFSVLLSSVILDTTIPMATVANLTTNLTAIQAFTGMDTGIDSTPDYSAHNALTYISDGWSLERAIAALDDAIASALPAYTSKAILFGDGTNVPITDATLFAWDNIGKRLGVGTNVPEESLDVRGKIQHLSGVVSRGGNARGASASDFQCLRVIATQVASGARSFIAGGEENTASAVGAFAAGKGTLASGAQSTALGEATTASGLRSLAGGNATLASAPNAVALGDSSQATGSGSFATGSWAKAQWPGARAFASTKFGLVGDAQCSEVVVSNQTTGVGPFQLYLDGTTATSKIILDDFTSYNCVVTVVGRVSGGNTNSYVLEGTIRRDANAASTALAGGVIQRVLVEQVGAGCNATLIADAGVGALIVEVTGVVAETIRWVAHVKFTSVRF